MKKRSGSPVKEDISPNVVPMIDIMFLLMLFFMLSADMSQRESVTVKLPVVDQVRPDPGCGDPTTIVNVHSVGFSNEIAANEGASNPRADTRDGGWRISMRGESYTVEQLRTQLGIEADEFPEGGVDPVARRVLSRKKLLIRAEQSAPFGLVHRVIETAGVVGMYKVELAGAQPAPRE